MKKDIRMNFAYDGQYVTFHPETNTNQVLYKEGVDLTTVLNALRRPAYTLVKQVQVSDQDGKKIFTFNDSDYVPGESVLVHRGGELLDESEYIIDYADGVVTIEVSSGLLSGTKLHFMVLRLTLSPEVTL